MAASLPSLKSQTALPCRWLLRSYQFDPQGVQQRQIDLPATQITSMAFGGDTMDLLLVTSASAGLNAAQLAASPQAGCTFVLRPGVAGLLPFAFG